MIARFCLPILALSLLVGASQAQGVDIPVPVAEDLFPGAGSIVLDPVDLDGDGVNEALVRRPTDCEGSACAWALMQNSPEGWVPITAGRAARVDFVQTGSSAALVADGVLWAWDGEQLYPAADLLEGTFVDAAPADLDLAHDLLGLSHIPAGTASSGISAQADVDGDGAMDRIVVITDQAWMLEGAYSPFSVIGAAGELIASGYSMDAPRLYPASGAFTATIVSVTPAGLQVQPISAGAF